MVCSLHRQEPPSIRPRQRQRTDRTDITLGHLTQAWHIECISFTCPSIHGRTCSAHSKSFRSIHVVGHWHTIANRACLHHPSLPQVSSPKRRRSTTRVALFSTSSFAPVVLTFSIQPSAPLLSWLRINSTRVNTSVHVGIASSTRARACTSSFARGLQERCTTVRAGRKRRTCCTKRDFERWAKEGSGRTDGKRRRTTKTCAWLSCLQASD